MNPIIVPIVDDKPHGAWPFFVKYVEKMEFDDGRTGHARGEGYAISLQVLDEDQGFAEAYFPTSDPELQVPPAFKPYEANCMMVSTASMTEVM